MTRAEYVAAVTRLGWSLRSLAALMGRPASTVRNWGLPGYTVPPDVAAWLRQAEAWLAANPPPGGARRR